MLTCSLCDKGTSTSSSTDPIGFCQNSGTFQNGRCICPEEWIGLRCTIINFCENSTHINFTFPRIPVGRYGSSMEKCEKETPNAGNPKATRLCNFTDKGEIKLQEVVIGNCSVNLGTLEMQIDDISNKSDSISRDAQVLTSDTNKLTPNNITAATRVVGQIFNTSRNATLQAKEVAVTTVSQLLEASEESFRIAAAAADATFTTLVDQMKNYSLSLENKSVVTPNVVVESVKFSSEKRMGSTGVRFTVQKGASSSLVSSPTSVDTNADDIKPSDQTELQIWLDTTHSNSCGFIIYQNSKLFQSKIFTPHPDFTQRVISGATDQDKNDQSVRMAFRNQSIEGFKFHSFACVYWSFSVNDWATNGCFAEEGTGNFLRCSCNHTTNFAVLMSFKKDYKYPEPLNTLSMVGCALSITGLILTIIFQIVTRKFRKTSVTWVLVSLCMSMLIFNLLFVFGIENSNKNSKDTDTPVSSNNEISNLNNNVPRNPACTVMAALLHYFLLVTFTWTGLSATQLYFLLIRTMKPLPRRFILYASLIGWGIPAIVVAMTVGIIFLKNRNDTKWELYYREEEICWLAGREKGAMESPLVWSFILPVTIILISNVVLFIIITVKVLWKNNQNLTSTKKISSLKKVLSTLSIAVVFGITWILAYLMLIENADFMLFFSYIFCLFNTTQGLQIFILHTVRTRIFQSEAAKVLKSLSSATRPVKWPPSATPLRLRVRMYNMLRSWPILNEHFRLLEPSIITEETTLSETDQANTSN
ncbi:adhesion G-protein coupled receptor G7 isoform X2 [Saccopteryx bilineata]|uniref:adhesion G-protein coupled receptor G7 isoform X2 n=1 Tax=Saccopteryx bilineata TaxID=59482 RepID=UPI00338ED383